MSLWCSYAVSLWFEIPDHFPFSKRSEFSRHPQSWSSHCPPLVDCVALNLDVEAQWLKQWPGRRKQSFPFLFVLTLDGEGSRPEFSLIELTAFLWLSFLLPEGRLLLDSSVGETCQENQREKILKQTTVISHRNDGNRLNHIRIGDVQLGRDWVCRYWWEMWADGKIYSRGSQTRPGGPLDCTYCMSLLELLVCGFFFMVFLHVSLSHMGSCTVSI